MSESYWKDIPTGEDLAWEAALGGDYPRAMAEAIIANKGHRVAYLLQRYAYTRSGIRSELERAVKAGAPAAVESLLTPFGFDLGASLDEDNEIIRKCLAIAIDGNFHDVVSVLCRYDGNRNVATSETVAAIYIRNDCREGFDTFFSARSKDDTLAYRAALLAAAAESDAWLGHVLTFTPRFITVQDSLNRALVIAADRNSDAGVDMLLEEGADPNASGGKAFFKAAEARNLPMVQAMVAKGLRLESYGAQVLKEIKEQKAQSPLVSYLEEKLATIKTTSAIKKQEDTRYRLAAKSILKDTLDLIDGPRLTTLFNFETRQQIIVVERKDQPLPPAVKDFSEVDPATIDRAAEIMKSLGGDVNGYESMGASSAPIKRKAFGGQKP